MSATLHSAEGSPVFLEEPTSEMLLAGLQCANRNEVDLFVTELMDIYKAMVAVAPSGWIDIEERLPELGASVALLKADGWENTGGDLEMNIRACGYLADGGPFRYWSIRGERATELKYFTHWMPLPLPPAPNQGEAS
jgi:hypothetical protein